MKFEDAMRSIRGAESVGGQLIVQRGGRNVLVGKDLQGTLIVEDTPEAKDIVAEFDDKAFEDGREASEIAEDRSPLSTHPTKATLRSTDPVPYLSDEQQPNKGGVDTDTLRDAQDLPRGSDPNTPHANTKDAHDRDREREERHERHERDKEEHEGKTHEQRVDDHVETKDKPSSKK